MALAARWRAISDKLTTLRKTHRKMRDRRFWAPLDSCLSGSWLASAKRPLASVVLAGGAAPCIFASSFWSVTADIAAGSSGSVSGFMNMVIIRRSPHRFIHTCNRVSIWLDHFLLCRAGLSVLGAAAGCLSIRTRSGTGNEIAAITRKALNRGGSSSAPTLDNAASTT